MNIRVIDTTIMLNLLGVPKRCADQTEVLEQFKKALEEKDKLILPIATIIETGNEIAKIQGTKRHEIAQKFAVYLKNTANDNAPWSCESSEIGKKELMYYADHFTEFAIQEVGMGDLSIIMTYEKCKEIPAIGHIEIWSTDKHLSGYHEDAVYKIKRRK
ncbi:MAG: hypothetical protein IJM23_03060 [Lachnospiraceae bacterium]|nr:hypothetical protein [Lachnospiraceae bacterium]